MVSASFDCQFSLTLPKIWGHFLHILNPVRAEAAPEWLTHDFLTPQHRAPFPWCSSLHVSAMLSSYYGLHIEYSLKAQSGTMGGGGTSETSMVTGVPSKEACQLLILVLLLPGLWCKEFWSIPCFPLLLPTEDQSIRSVQWWDAISKTVGFKNHSFSL